MQGVFLCEKFFYLTKYLPFFFVNAGNIIKCVLHTHYILANIAKKMLKKYYYILKVSVNSRGFICF